MSASGQPAAPHWLRIAAALVAVEAVGLLAYAVAEAASISSGRAALGLSTAVFFGVYALGLCLAARGLLRRASWSRGPVVFSQLVQLGVAWNLRSTEVWPVAVGLATLAAVVLTAVLAPATTRALGE